MDQRVYHLETCFLDCGFESPYKYIAVFGTAVKRRAKFWHKHFSRDFRVERAGKSLCLAGKYTRHGLSSIDLSMIRLQFH